MPKRFQYTTAEIALKLIQSNQRIFLHGSAATPTFLVKELAKQSSRLKNVEVVCISVMGEFPLANPELADSFFINSLFVTQPWHRSC